jgi:hypothetical protein
LNGLLSRKGVTMKLKKQVLEGFRKNFQPENLKEKIRLAQNEEFYDDIRVVDIVIPSSAGQYMFKEFLEILEVDQEFLEEFLKDEFHHDYEFNLFNEIDDILNNEYGINIYIGYCECGICFHEVDHDNY